MNGNQITDETLNRYIKDLKGVFERFRLTYFEATVLIALLYFADQGVDVAVMEVGMGGRWDATKVCGAEVVVITNAERDHTRWLGKNVEE
ncbi:MAG: Mur ligase family protein [Aquificota bacterium]|nr:Mur ligase family protein [Aquificota bacterium]